MLMVGVDIGFRGLLIEGRQRCRRMLYNWLYPLHTQFSFLNVFRYQSFRIIYAAVTAFLIAFVMAPG